MRVQRLTRRERRVCKLAQGFLAAVKSASAWVFTLALESLQKVSSLRALRALKAACLAVLLKQIDHRISVNFSLKKT